MESGHTTRNHGRGVESSRMRRLVFRFVSKLSYSDKKYLDLTEKRGCLKFQPGSWLVGKLSLWLSSWRPPSNPPELHAQPFTFRNKAAAAGTVPITGHFHSNYLCNPKTWTKH